MAEENKFKAFFKNAKAKLDDAALDSKIKSDFNSKHKSYTIYSGCGLLNSVSYDIYGDVHLDEGYILSYNNYDLTSDMLIKDNETNKVYKIKEVTDEILHIEYEGDIYDRAGKKIVLGDEATKVSVVKVNDEYYLNK